MQFLIIMLAFSCSYEKGPLGITTNSPFARSTGRARAGVCCAVVPAIAVDPGGVAIIIRLPDHHGVARHRHRETERVIRPGVAGLAIGLRAKGRVNGERAGLFRALDREEK